MVVALMASTVWGSPALRNTMANHARNLADFDWAIIPNQDWLVAFAETGEEIKGTYNISEGKNYSFSVYNHNCTIAFDDPSTDVGITVIPAISDEANNILEVAMDLNPSQLVITSNEIVFEADIENGIDIRFCLRVDLMTSDDETTATSVNFHVTQFDIQVDTSTGFSVTSIDTEREDAQITNEDATLEYNVVAHRLSYDASDFSNMSAWSVLTSDEEDALPNIGNGGELAIVIQADNSPAGVNMVEILSFNLVSGAVDNDLASNTYAGGILWDDACGVLDGKPTCGARTILIAEYFATNEAQTASGSGLVLFSFGSGSSRRLESRTLQIGGEENNGGNAAQFELNVNLQGNQNLDNGEEESSAPTTVTTSFLMTIVVGMGGSALLFFM